MPGAFRPKIYTIFEGTSEIQRLVIARAISGRQIR
nr:acyl-CoA dehydrogenase family protein [Streptomyces sp. f150]